MNVIVTLRGRGHYRSTMAGLRHFGAVKRTGYYNVLQMDVDGPRRLLDALEAQPALAGQIGELVPLDRTFTFGSPAEFEERAGEAVRALAPQLAGKSFHVRIHRRGFKGRISSLDEEKALAAEILRTLEEGGATARVTFEDPDAVVTIETLGNDAGVSLWTKAEARAHPLLHWD